MPPARTLPESSAIESVRLASPHAIPELTSEPGTTRDVLPWRVVHVCEHARDVLAVVECELVVGMRPFIVTARGSGTASKYYRSPKERIQTTSLLQAWSDVRTWKRLLIESDPEGTAEVVHAHSFAAGMAGVRADAPLVYDIHPSNASMTTEDNSWLGRSFRVAEQFVLTSAGAVIVHSQDSWRECQRLGVEETNLFYIPQPVDPGWLESVPDRHWIEQRLGGNGATTIFFAPRLSKGPERDLQISALLKAFALTHDENDNVRLVFLDDTDAESIRRCAEAQNIHNLVHLLPQAERELIFASCDIVIACESSDDDCQPLLSIEALARGRALLVCDKKKWQGSVPLRSCLWFRPEEPRELGHRMAFLARNPDFCRLLSSHGQREVVTTRSPEVVGRLYDHVYRQVVAKKKQRDRKPNEVRFIPLQANL